MRFIGINEDFIPQKQEDKDLKRNVDKDEILSSLCKQNDPQNLVIFCKNITANDQLEHREQIAWQVLQCFCEESAYKATIQVFGNVNYNQHEMMLKGLFIARQFIYDLEKFKPVICKYDPKISSLRYYVQKVLENIIKDQLKLKFSKWRKLNKASKNELEKALLNYGIYKDLIVKIKFALKLFKQVYINNRIKNNITRKSGEKWPEPKISDYEECVQLYNSEIELKFYTDQDDNIQKITLETLQKWIDICNKALSDYDNIEKNITEYKDNVNPKEKKIDNPHRKINPLKLDLQLIIAQFRVLNTTKQKTLIYFYGFNMKSNKIGDIFSVGSTAILHRLKNIRKQFMDTLMKTLYEPSDREEWAKTYIGNWLINNYQKPVYSNYFHCLLMKAIKTLDVQEQHLLQKKFGQKTGYCQLTEESGMLEEDLVKMINRIKAKLEQAFLKEIERIIQRDLPKMLSTLSKDFIDRACLNLGFSEIEIAYLHLRISAREWSDMENVDIILNECLKILNWPQ
ncbi:MAG: hypothetical protein ACKO11_15345 [Cuspidothrix sp.]